MALPIVRPHIDVVYDGGVRSDITISQDDVDRYLKSCLHDSCEIIRNRARREHKFTNRTERLVRAIRFSVLPRAKEGRIGRVYIDTKMAPHGKWILEGTGLYGPKRHWIFPQRKKALHWFSKKGFSNPAWNRFKPPLARTEWVVGRIRGMHGEDFLKNAYENSEKEVNEIFADGLRRLLSGKL